MKMTYVQQQSSLIQRRNRLVFAVCAVLAILAVLMKFLAPNFLPSLFTSVALPFWRTQFSIGSGSLRSPSQLLSENEQLKRDLAESQIRLETIRAIETENKELKSFLGRSISTTTTDSILAVVLKRPPFTAYDELIIDIGKDRGLATDDQVYATGHILVGQISRVLSKSAIVTLYSSPNVKHEVLIGTTNVPATAIGRGGGQYEAELPRNSSVKEGDFVTAPSLSDKPFAIVSGIVADPAEVFEKILFAPLVNIYELKWVMVVKK
jgi:cell shape-determining protein MreC